MSHLVCSVILASLFLVMESTYPSSILSLKRQVTIYQDCSGGTVFEMRLAWPCAATGG